MKKQRDWTIKQLQEFGKVSRNEALRNYFSRLGAVICDLNKEGWEIFGDFEKTPNGKDYVYRVVKMPFKKVEYFVPSIGKTITKFEPINETH